MSSQTLIFDTSFLPHDLLSYSDDLFFRVVKKTAGVGEAKLLEAQGIRSVYSFFNTADVFEILLIPCTALKDIKKLVCLEADDKTFTVKPGCRSTIRYLYQLLHQKHDEHVKDFTRKSKRNKKSLSPTKQYCCYGSFPRFTSRMVQQHLFHNIRQHHVSFHLNFYAIVVTSDLPFT